MTTLETLQEDLKQKRFYDIAVIIRKYQDYRSDIAISKMDNSLGKSTRANYLSCGIRYLKTQVKSAIVPKSLYEALDKVMEQHIQPLRPNVDERKRNYKRDYTKKEITLPVARNEVLSKPLTAKVEYGVRVNDNIVLQKTEEEARAFMRGINFLNPNNQIAKIVTVELGEVD